MSHECEMPGCRSDAVLRDDGIFWCDEHDSSKLRAENKALKAEVTALRARLDEALGVLAEVRRNMKKRKRR